MSTESPEQVEAVASAESNLSQAVEAETVETPVIPDVVEAAEPEAVEETEPEVATFAVDELQRMVTDFGVEVACATILNGGGYADALRLAHEAAQAELAEARKEIAALSASRPAAGAAPAAFADGENRKRKMSFIEAVQSRISNK